MLKRLTYLRRKPLPNQSKSGNLARHYDKSDCRLMRDNAEYHQSHRVDTASEWRINKRLGTSRAHLHGYPLFYLYCRIIIQLNFHFQPIQTVKVLT